MTKLIHPMTFIDKLIKKKELRRNLQLMDHQREIPRLAFDFDKDGPPHEGSRLLRRVTGVSKLGYLQYKKCRARSYDWSRSAKPRPVIMAATSPALAPVRITILGSRARSAVGCSEHEPI